MGNVTSGPRPASLPQKSWFTEKQVALRVRREYFKAIKSGAKTVEYRKFSTFWQQRLANATIAVFVCGKDVHRRRIIRKDHIPTPLNFSEQGRKDVPTATCFAIFLGESLDTTGYNVTGCNVT